MDPTMLLSGYMEKKKRKSYQGMAKRFFMLNSSGTLSYSRVQGEPVRDSVNVARCSVGRSKKRRQIVIDSGDKVPWHCKALSDQDYERWVAALHNFAHVKEHAKIAHGQLVDTPRRESPAPVDHLIGADVSAQLVTVITNMTKSITALERIAEDAASSQQPGTGQAGSVLGKAVNYASSTANSVAHAFVSFEDAGRVNADKLADAVNHLKEQHTQALHLLNQSHIANDDYGLSRRLSLAESVAASEYYDAEAGYSYELDIEGDETAGYTSSSSDSSGSMYHSDEDTEVEDDASSTRSDATESGDSKPKADNVNRRKQLPHPLAGEEVSLFSLLKRNMGKDLSKISFPVTLNEPIDQLQAMAEPLEYSDLLDTAAKQKQSLERLLYVALFAIASYAPTKYRSSRKPFNPLLGQTFELVRPDKGIKFIAEKVVHHPNWTVGHAIGKGWDYTASASGAQKFWGRSYELLPEGMNEVRIKEHDEVYTWTRPSTYVKNIMSGEKYLEHVGVMEVHNEDTGERAAITFKEGSSWGGTSSRNKVEGKVFDTHDTAKIEIQGKWDESIARNTGGKNWETVWQIHDFPENAPKYYGFSEWSVQLNELTDDIRPYLPPTDTRFRPDQRALEEGNVDEAEHGKQALEQKQRDRRKRWEQNPSEKTPPQFFREQDANSGIWHYSGDYWERREKKNWRKEIRIFDL